MKLKTLCWLTLALAMLACPTALFASDFDGTWKGTREGRDGNPVEMVYKLKVEGETLTGTITTPRREITIEDGKVNGSEITFNTSFGENKIPHQGKLADGKITISVETPNGKREYVLTKAEDKQE